MHISTGGTTVQGMPLMRVPMTSNPWRITGPPVRLTSSSTFCGSARVSANGQVVLMIFGALSGVRSMPLPVNPQTGAVPLRQEPPARTVSWR